MSPYSFEYAAKLHDAMTWSAFVQILGLDSIDDFTWNQASLNIKLGGFGLSEVYKSKCSAYVSSWAQSVRDLPNRFSSLSQRIQDLVENDSTSSSLSFDIHSAVKSLPPIRLGDDETPRSQSLSTLSATKGKLQHKLSSEIGLLSAAHYLSCALIAKDFRLASFLRLGLPMPFNKVMHKQM